MNITICYLKEFLFNKYRLIIQNQHKSEVCSYVLVFISKIRRLTISGINPIVGNIMLKASC